MCGDYFKGSTCARSALKDMVKIIGWFLKHPRANHLLQSQMAKPRALKLPVKTRWGSQARPICPAFHEYLWAMQAPHYNACDAHAA